MADEITVKATEEKSFAPCPIGSQHAVCVDVIDLGETVEQYQNEAPHKVRKCVVVFQTDEENPDTGKRYEPSIEFSVTFGKKAKLRKMLGAWRGKAYSDEEAMRDGAPLHKLVGVNAILTILHKTSRKERVYAVIDGIAPAMKSLPKIVPNDYERSAHWELRKKDYAAAVAEFDRLRGPDTPTNFEQFPEPLQPEDGEEELAF